MRAVAGFGIVSFFSDLAHESASAVLPVLLTGFGAPPVALGVIEGVSDGASAFCKLAAGRFADRLGRLKPATILGYVVTALAVPAIALATTWTQVLVLRTLAWLGRGLRSPLRDTLLVRVIPEEKKGTAFGIERAMDQCGALLGPLLVVLLVHEGTELTTIVGLTLIPGVLAVLGMTLLVPEAKPATPGTKPAAAIERAPPDPRFRRLVACLFVFGCGDFAKTLIVQWAIGKEASEGITAGVVTLGALLYAGFNAVTIVAALIGGRLSDRVGRKRVLAFGYGAGAIGAIVPVVATPSIAAAVLALAFSGVLVGVQEAVERAWAADLTPGGKRGRAFGIVHATNGIGDLVASSMVGSLWWLMGAQIAFGAGAALMTLGAFLVTTIPEATSKSPNAG